MGNTAERVREYENKEWLDSLEYIYREEGPQRMKEILGILQTRAQKHGVRFQCPGTTPYINTIPPERQPDYPGDRALERRIKSIIRWNAMAMVVRANKELSGIGGHISTFASAATLFEVGFNHFFQGKQSGGKQSGADKERGNGGPAGRGGDVIYFQGHASPGVYARAFLEGRFSEPDLKNFRRELKPEGGMASYPHPWLVPGFWEYPTVSMGLAPIMSIYQARFNHYLRDRGLLDTSGRKVWAFLGDGEMDEPESMGAITLAAREELDNLIFVINCNLQRLDGPVRGNQKVIQELEAAFSGAGWNVIKVIWGSDWDPIIERDESGALVEALNQIPDGQVQKFTVAGGAYIRENFFGKDERLAELIEDYSDEQLEKLRRGGHDPAKVYAAYKAAVEHTGTPTVILAQTIKGYGLGEAGEGKNITHQQKKLNEQELREFRDRFDIPVSDEKIGSTPFYKPEEDSPEIEYLNKRREELGGFVPERQTEAAPLELPGGELFEEFYEDSGDREVASTMVMVRLMAKLLQDKNIGSRIVPIVPDEARTFGMESLFRQFGIYSHQGQVYEPVDKQSLLYYREAKEGVILEEGITEAGCMSSFIAAGTSYATHGMHMLPFFFFYSMFGFQRIGDLIWAAGDARARGFLVGGTSGRTTLPGEGLQHQDGNSHVLALALPNLLAYDPAYAYEIAVIVKDGMRRMITEGENILYYITVMNEFYHMPAMPDGVEDGIIRGMYRFRKAGKKANVSLLGSGAILNETIKAADLLEEKYDLPCDVWSVTSFKQLYTDAIDTARRNRLNPGKGEKPYVTRCLEESQGVFVAATDYLKALPLTIAPWIPGPYAVLGTDGYGRSDGREPLRDFFENDARHIALAALHSQQLKGGVDEKTVREAVKEFNIDAEKPNPRTS